MKTNPLDSHDFYGLALSYYFDLHVFNYSVLCTEYFVLIYCNIADVMHPPRKRHMQSPNVDPQSPIDVFHLRPRSFFPFGQYSLILSVPLLMGLMVTFF